MVYVFANGNEGGDGLKLALQVNGPFDKYEYAEGKLPGGDNLIAVSETAATVISFELAPQTVVVWKQK